MAQTFVPDRRRPAPSERMRLFDAYKLAARESDTDYADALLELDSELFDVTPGQPVTWREETD